MLKAAGNQRIAASTTNGYGTMTKNFFTKIFGGKKTEEKLHKNAKNPSNDAQKTDFDPLAEQNTTPKEAFEAENSPISSVDEEQSASPRRSDPISEHALEEKLEDDDKNTTTVVDSVVEDRRSDDVTGALPINSAPSTTKDETRDAPLKNQSVQDATSSNEPTSQGDPTAFNEQQTQQPSPDKPKKSGWLSRLRGGLRRTSSKIADGVSAIFTKRKLDDDALEELEDLLITADLGVQAAQKVTQTLAKDRFEKEVTDREVREALAVIVSEILSPLEAPLEINAEHRPHVILMTGVNGAGKTTTIGKLAAQFKAEGKTVMLAAGDTFRAAAIEQLEAWGKRAGAPVVARSQGADAAGLAYDALNDAKAANCDVLIVDTAGRLQNKSELMDELAKIVRVMRKLDPSAPHNTLLVLDATVGQNAVSQAATFKEVADVTGLVMTKLDGTARGGVLVALGEAFSLPIHYIGVGEGIDDLQTFKAAAFAKALTGLDETDMAV